MSDRAVILLSGTSLVLYGSATAIRGLVVGDIVQLAVGVCALVLVLSGAMFDVPRRSPQARRRLLAFVAMFERWRRLSVIFLVVYVGVRAVWCIASAARHDWWNFLYFAVTGLAAIGILASTVASPTEANVDEADALRRGHAAP